MGGHAGQTLGGADALEIASSALPLARSSIRSGSGYDWLDGNIAWFCQSGGASRGALARPALTI